MSAPLSVSLWPADADGPGTPLPLRPVWASLPLSLAESGDTGRLLAVDGRGEGWAGDLAAALQSGPSGVLLITPSPGVDPDTVAELAARAAAAGTSVVVQSAWATDPGVGAYATATAGELAGMVLVDVLSTVDSATPDHPTLPAMMLDQLQLLRALGLRLGSVSASRWLPDSVTVIGTVGAATAVLSAAVGGAAPQRLRFTARGAATESQLIVYGSADARPAEAELTTAAGTQRLPSLFESAARSAWRRLHAAVARSEPVDELTGLAADLRLLASTGPLL